ncbi:MAG TPA: ABC transporter substrate-binding protein [Chloroflexota bacterium]|nr:ABC transporter substrate-binding protein [Chloroflexota bacterium]
MRFSNRILSLATFGSALLLAACGSAASPAPSSAPASVGASSVAASAKPATSAAPASGPGSAKPAASAAPASGAASAKPAASAATHVKIALTSKSTGGLYLFVGKDLGIYQRYGLDPEIVIGDSGAIVTGLTSGDLDFLGTTPSGIQGAERGLPIRVIYTAKDHPEYLLVGDKGITQVSQLKGKNLAGSTPAQLPAQMTRLLLQMDGLQPSDYTVINVANDPARAAMVENHQAAAASVGVAEAIPLLNSGYPEIDSTLSKIWFPSNGLAATLKTMQERADLTKRMVAATIEATSVTANQKDQVIPVMVKEFNFSEADASKVFDMLQPSYTKDGRAAPEAIQTQIKLDADAMQLPQPATPEQIYDNSFLPPAS